MLPPRTRQPFLEFLAYATEGKNKISIKINKSDYTDFWEFLHITFSMYMGTDKHPNIMDKAQIQDTIKTYRFTKKEGYFKTNKSGQYLDILPTKKLEGYVEFMGIRNKWVP